MRQRRPAAAALLLVVVALAVHAVAAERLSAGTIRVPLSAGGPTVEYAIQGCYSDRIGANDRLLPLVQLVSNEVCTCACGMHTYVDARAHQTTPQWCVSHCAARGFVLAGVEYGEECYCSDAMEGAVKPLDADMCVCAGPRVACPCGCIHLQVRPRVCR